MSERTFFIDVRNGGVYVSLAIGKERQVTAETILDELKLKGIRNYEKRAIDRLMITRSNDWIKVADATDVLKDGEINVVVSEDELEAQVMVLPPESDGRRVTADEVLYRLDDNGVSYGIDIDEIRAAMENFNDLPLFFTIKGKPCIHGEDAKIEYLVEDSAPKIAEPEDSEARLDFKNLNMVSNVLVDQPLAVKTPITQGEDGMTVTGKPIVANKGRDIPLPAGSGTKIAKGGLTLISAIEGLVKIIAGKVTVLPVLMIKGDIDYHTGNINFVGTVFVSGDIREGFSVLAEGDINVDGVVEGASVSCKGDLRAKGGVRGMGKASIKAEGEVAARYIDQAWVRSGKGVYVIDAITHSNIGSDGEIVIRGGRKAQLVGGTTVLKGDLTCNIVGSKMGTRTEITAGISPALKEWNDELKERLTTLASNMKKLENTVKHYETLEGFSKLSPEDKTTYEMAVKTKDYLRREVERWDHSLKEVKAQIAELHKNPPTIQIRGTCHPGVVFNLGGHKKEIKAETKGVSVVALEDRIFVFDLSSKSSSSKNKRSEDMP